MITVVSLFDGIACGRVALERASIKVKKYYAFEIDKYAILIAQRNYPDIVQMGNVIDVDFKQFKGKVDILIGGSPCQNLSCAGNRKGLKGEESKLFFEFVRAKQEINPKYFLLENNASMSKDNQYIISQSLGCDAVLINSSLFSAQNRKRLYWTNIPFDTSIQDKNITLQSILEYGTTERNKSKTVRVGGARSGWGNKHEWDMPNPERIYTTVELERLQTIPDNYTNVVSDIQRRKCIGNAWTVDVIVHILKGIKSENKVFEHKYNKLNRSVENLQHYHQITIFEAIEQLEKSGGIR